ncbi:MAG: glycosyltransferase family 4 protein [Fibrobacterota bacterium]
MEKIKVVHLYKSFNVYNGLIEILTIMAQNFDHSRFELGACVFEYDGNEFGEKFKSLGGKIFSLDVPQKVQNEPKSFLKLVNFFKEYKPHVVQTHVLKANLIGSMAARMAGVPVVIGTEMTLKDTAPSKIGRIRDRFVQPLTTFALRKCDSFVVTSEFIRKEWQSAWGPESFEVVYPPFNLEKYRSAIRRRKSPSGKGCNIGFIGRLSDEKSIDKLLEAMKIVSEVRPEAKLSIVGTGPLEGKLKQYCRELGLDGNVQFTGYKSNVFEALRDFDLFVLSSRTEGCPIVILEAMAMGLPVVATNVGGNPELVQDGKTGILIPPNNPQRMASALIELISNAKKASEMGQAGKRRAFSVFHPSKFSSSLEKLYKDLYQKKTSVSIN